MKAMVLAAGLGTRLRPLTNDRPKALVQVAGHTMLELTLARLRSFGVIEAIVNTHHYRELMRDFIESHDFGMRVVISEEEDLLDTGGGLKNAAWFFTDSQEPFIVHNVDVLSNIDLAQMLRFHIEQNALVTLAVQDRSTSRPLLFDATGQLRGRARKDEPASDETSALAFSGIHIVSPRIFSMMEEEGAFSIIDTYVRLAARGEKIVGFRADSYYWRDLGKPENVENAALDIRKNVYALA